MDKLEVDAIKQEQKEVMQAIHAIRLFFLDQNYPNQLALDNLVNGFATKQFEQPHYLQQIQMIKEFHKLITFVKQSQK